MPKINLLSKNVSELIAAGEVIDKPASLIKEVIENSIDSGATSITVEIKNGGISFMRVSDNGCGISFEDAPKAFLRHATSKVATEADLENIGTMGFRGEALASIAAVAKVELMSKQAGEELGCLYKIEGSEEKEHIRTGCPDGTIIIIRDLFYNVPARLKFLKKDISEGNSVQAMVDKLAIIHPEIKFKFLRDNKPVRITPGDGKLYSSMYAIFGGQFAASMIPVDFSQGGIKVTGYISSPNFCRKNRTMQFFYVNNRYFRSTACMAAVENGYTNNIMVGKFPACILNIEISPSEVDVNVHPTKTEVRFSNNDNVFNAIYFAVKNAILNADNKKEISIEVEEYTQTTSPRFDMKPATLLSSPVKAYSVTGVSPTTMTYSTRESLPEVVIDEKDEIDLAEKNDIIIPPAKKYDDDIFPEKNFQSQPSPKKSYKYIEQNLFTDLPQVAEEQTLCEVEDELVVIGEVFRTYILCQHDEEIVLIDKHAAHERLKFERLKRELITTSQILGESIFVKMEQEQVDAVSDAHGQLMEIGFDVIKFDDYTIEIAAMPSMLEGEDVFGIVGEIADILVNRGSDLTVIFDDILHSIACRSAIKANDKNDLDDLTMLAKAVWDDKSIRFCPHGRPIILSLKKAELEKMFKRIT